MKISLKYLSKYTWVLVLLAMPIFFSCNKDLERLQPNTVNPYSTALGYKQSLAGVYSGFAVTSPSGSGSATIGGPGVDPGSTDYLRNLWNAQELPTDEAKCAWITNAGIPDLNTTTPLSSNGALYYVYERCILQIMSANDFIKNSSDGTIGGKGFSATDIANIKYYRAEARFLRAYQYSVLMDLFGNPPFVTENDPVGTFVAPQITRANLFKYIESELKAIDPLLVAPMKNEYGRADQAAAWSLLARIYLNAEVYTGTPRYTDAITYSSKVINAGFQLNPSFQSLFSADNNLNNSETIFPIVYDLNFTQTYGGTTFLVCSASGGDASNYGVNGNWYGNRATKNLPLVFGSYTGGGDTRSMFINNGTPDINSIAQYSDGVEVHKFNNLLFYSNNTPATTTTGTLGTYCSADFPLFRLAEQYLIYAEAVLRNGTGGDIATAVHYINLLKERAYKNTSNDVTSIKLDDILTERSKELYWECQRRTDLVRFGKFTSADYLWPWKGGVATGTSVDSHYNLYAIPTQDIAVNPNLKQNPGY